MAKAVQLIDKNNNKCYAAPYWPIGSIYISVVNTNPSKWFGGTWQSFGAGRVLVGVDTSQVEFNSVLKTGGSKETEKHRHYTNSYPYAKTSHVDTGGMWVGEEQQFVVVGNRLDNTLVGTGSEARIYGSQINDEAKLVTDYFGNGNSGNLQPYITVYMWRRTA